MSAVPEPIATFRALQRKIGRHVDDLQIIGENEMGLLTTDMARRYHDAVAKLARVNLLMQATLAEYERISCDR